jgi:hypothetical protein
MVLARDAIGRKPKGHDFISTARPADLPSPAT